MDNTCRAGARSSGCGDTGAANGIDGGWLSERETLRDGSASHMSAALVTATKTSCVVCFILLSRKGGAA